MFNLPGSSIIPLERVEVLRRSIADLFIIDDTTLDSPEPGYVRFRGRFLQDPADCFDELRRRFEAIGFTPLIRNEKGETAVFAMPVVFNSPPSNWRLNLILFIITLLSTLITAAFYETGSLAISQWWRGWPFSLSIMLILGAHELGHYFAARYHKVPVTLPYFIPLPLISPIGTLGAFIRLKAPVKNRRALLDVGMAGPWAGILFAVPILIYGLATSEIITIGDPGLLEGNSILYAALKITIFGRMLPNGAEDVLLNQVAWAGWVGLLVTALNLMPVGQLDGGHVTYALLGKYARRLFWPVIITLAALGVFSVLQGDPGNWMIWILLLFFFGRVHAEPLDDVTQLDGKRRLIALATLVLFVLVFVPVPFRIVGA